MEFKPKAVRVIVRRSPYSVKQVRVEVKDPGNDGDRKIHSFNLYDTSLDEVMKVLVKAFEKEVKEPFNYKIKMELGLIPERIPKK